MKIMYKVWSVFRSHAWSRLRRHWKEKRNEKNDKKGYIVTVKSSFCLLADNGVKLEENSKGEQLHTKCKITHATELVDITRTRLTPNGGNLKKQTGEFERMGLFLMKYECNMFTNDFLDLHD